MTWDWHHLGFAHASGILHIATDFSQVRGSYPPTWTSQCGLQNPRGSCSKVYIGHMGSYRTMVQKSALTSGTTAQLAVLAECAFEQMHIYDWVEGSISGRLPFLTTARKESINYYSITLKYSIVFHYIIYSINYNYFNIVLFLRWWYVQVLGYWSSHNSCNILTN